MQDKQEKIKRKTQKVIDNNGSTPLAHLDVAMETNEKLEELVNPERVQKMEIMGAEIITIKGAKGDKGDTGEQGLQGEQGIQGIKGDKGEQGIQGLKGETGEKGKDGIDGKDGKDGQNGTDGKDGSPDTAGELATKLETLEGDDRLSINAIKGIDFVKTADFKLAMSNIKGFMPYGNGSSSSSTASLAIGSAITGATAGSVLFAGAGGLLSQDNTNFNWNNTTKQLTLSSSLTGSQATNGLSITPTWNTTGNPVALSVNITNTASGTASKLFDFQTNSVSKLSLTPGGLLQFGVTGTGGVQSHSINPVIYMGTNIVGLTSGNGDLMLSGRQGYGIGFQTSASGATVLRLAILNNGTIQLAGGAIVTGDPVFTGTNNSGQTGPALNNSGSGGGTSVNLYLRTAGTDRASIGAFNTGDFIIRTGGSTEAVRINATQKVGIGVNAPTAWLHLKAGTTAASTAPLKFNSGSLMTAPEIGAVEFLTDRWYGTITTGTTRKEFTMNDIPLTSGQVPYVASNGLLTSNSSMTTDGSGGLTIAGAFSAGSYTDFTSTPFSTSNGITVSLSNQLLASVMSVTADAATSITAGIVDTNAQGFGGNKHFYGRVLESSGTFSGTSSVTLGDDGNFFAMGSGTLDEINLTGWDNGSEISLYFPAGGTITNNFTPTGGYGPFLILAGANKTVTAGGIVKFILLNGNWMEVAS